MDIVRKMFTKSVLGGNAISKAIRMSPKMEQALIDVSEIYGWKPGDLIEYVLDQFLQNEVTKGTIADPQGHSTAS